MTRFTTSRPKEKTVLTIAGFDPSSGAGVTADLMVFAAHDLFGTSCITALTVQSTLGVQSVYPVSSSVVRETLEFLDEDLRPSGIKIGMLADEANLVAVSEYCRRIHAIVSHNSVAVTVPIVLDTVLRASSGKDLLDSSAVEALRDHLLPIASWITPNIDELGILAGVSVNRREDVPKACLALQAKVRRSEGLPPLGVLATGGHLEPPDDFLLTPEGDTFWLPGGRVATRSTHGTGCAARS
jgi:hydroxymethylpyrimidine/phosphomethylpyrimidine kinase